MQRELPVKPRGRIGLIWLAAAAAVIWWGLERMEPRADWLRVEAPRGAVAGGPLPMRVRLAPLAEPACLCADLHWGTTRDTSVGYLATGGSRLAGAEGGTFDFQIMVPPANGLRFVTGIIYLSRTGGWRDHTLVAATEAIPVRSNLFDKTEMRLEQLRVRPLGDGSQGHPRPAPIPRLLTALLFLAATVAAGTSRKTPSTSSGSQGVGNRWWQALAVLLALACLWEMFGLESWLGAHARAIARAKDFYYLRVVFQRVVISLAVAATVVSFVFVQRTHSSRRMLLAFSGLYLGISAVNLVSLHAIDRIADLSWYGLAVVQALKLGCAAMILQGVRRARRRNSEV